MSENQNDPSPFAPPTPAAAPASSLSFNPPPKPVAPPVSAAPAAEPEPVIVQGTPVARTRRVETKSYRLKPGRKHFDGAEGRALAPGDVVELDSIQAKAFRDKFEEVDNEPIDESDRTPNSRPKPTSHVPEDVGSKQPNEFDDNPSNKVPITARR